MKEHAIWITYDIVTRAYGVDDGVIVERSLKPRHVLARRVFAYLLHENVGMSYPEIARAMSSVNHSSAYHMVWQMRRRIANAPADCPERAFIEALRIKHEAALVTRAWRLQTQCERFNLALRRMGLTARSFDEFGQLDRLEVEARLQEVAA